MSFDPTPTRLCASDECEVRFAARETSRTKYCSTSCRGRHAYLRNRGADVVPREDRERTCLRCGSTFLAHKANYCSNLCRAAAHYLRGREEILAQSRERRAAARADKACKRCGSLFHPYGRVVYCSAECRQAAKKEHAMFRQRADRGRRRVSDAGGVVEQVSTADVREMLTSTTECPLCGVALVWGDDSPASRHVDHVIPVCKGGPHSLDNLRCVCKKCNQSRSKTR